VLGVKRIEGIEYRMPACHAKCSWSE